MPLSDQSSPSFATRQILLRVRADLEARRHKYLGSTHWIIKDPVGMRYFRFQEEEYALLRMLDGQTNLAAIQQEFEQRFAPRKLRLASLQQFIARLQTAGLLLMDQPGQGRKLQALDQETRQRTRRAALTNIFAIRFPGFDPDRLLGKLHRYVGWFFTAPCVALVLLLAFAALSTVVINLESFSARLPAAQLFFGPSNLHWLIVSMIFCKILHEFGHGLACKHFGGECHSMGAMLLFFAPAMYCDVSDSWLLPNKWQRMAIGAAGMYVEIFIASLATFGWWLSEPGFFNSICLSLMLLTSVSTILVNANPLMRYDGYFILSDFLEIPNLAQLSRELLRHYLVKWCLGIELPLGKRMPQRRRTWLTIYAFAAGVYRWLMVFGALWFVSGAFKHYDLQVLGRIAALFGLMALVIMPIWQTFQLLYVPGRISQMKTRRVLLVGGTLAAVLGVVLFVPMPRTIDCAAVIGVRDAETIYAPLPGKLTQVEVAYGDTVEPGTVIATLSNDNLELAIAELTGQVEELTAQLKGLNKERLVSSEAGRAIESVQETLAMAEQQLAERSKDRETLVRTASRTGVVLPSPNALSRRKMATTLAKAHGDPLEPHNLGMHLQAGEILCQIGHPHELELLILIDQSMREYVQVGAKVEAWPANSPYETLTSTITELSAAETHRAPPSLGNRHGGSVATQPSATEGEQLVSATYQARAPLDVESITLMPGLRCQVQIAAPPQTWGSRILRWVEETFRFRT